MPMTENQLRAIHTQACEAVLKSNRTVTPVDDAFWPLYLQAALNAALAANSEDTERLDWLDRNVSSSFDFEYANLTFRCPGDYLEGTNQLRDVIDYARRVDEEAQSCTTNRGDDGKGMCY